MSNQEEEYTLLLYKFLKQNKAVWSGGKVTAEITVDQTHIDLAETLHNRFPEYAYTMTRGDQLIGNHELKTGNSVTFELAPRRNRNLYHARDLDDLLTPKSALINRPTSIVVQNLDYIGFKPEVDEPKKITAYYRLNEFLKKLLDIGVLERRVDEDLILYFSSGTLKVEARTTGDVLSEKIAEEIISAVDLTLPILDDELHKDDKIRLLKAVLYDSWRSAREDERLNHFLRHSREIAKNFSNNYELFVSEFSFESEYEKLVKEQHEFSGRLSAILTSIQGRILAVPLSLILAFGQMKTKPEDNPLLINTGILLAAAVFSVLMWILLNSQNQVLVGLKEEIDSKVERFKINVPDLFEQVKELFTSLDNQQKSTRGMLRLLKVLIILGFAITLFAWAYLTPEVREAVANMMAPSG